MRIWERLRAAAFWHSNDARLLRLWRQGWTAQEIADEIGKSRNAVLGRIYRLRQSSPATVRRRRFG